MKVLKICILILFLTAFEACDNEFECDNFSIDEGEITMNGEMMYPISGTDLTAIETVGGKSISWTIRAAEDNCELSNEVSLEVAVENGEPVTGTFDFSEGAVGNVFFDIDGTGFAASEVKLEEGTFTVNAGIDGVYTISVDATDSESDEFKLSVNYDFE